MRPATKRQGVGRSTKLEQDCTRAARERWFSNETSPQAKSVGLVEGPDLVYQRRAAQARKRTVPLKVSPVRAPPSSGTLLLLQQPTQDAPCGPSAVLETVCALAARSAHKCEGASCVNSKQQRWPCFSSATQHPRTRGTQEDEEIKQNRAESGTDNTNKMMDARSRKVKAKQRMKQEAHSA